MVEPEESDGWMPLPAGWRFRDRRVVTRRAHDETLAWFPVPDPSGYAGIALALMEKTGPPREFWMWTDESSERLARVIRLGYQRYVVELHGVNGCAVIENPTRAGDDIPFTDDERNVLGRRTVPAACVLSFGVAAESCARFWLDHGEILDGHVVRQWTSE